ncbi:uncharacterized protein LOC125235150 [Leguminivora glycinivorella]|uniref:uncharacterized protein LOC125235150 n=1 Tax=Leguminivora glycinivorella TaxID=1035111 RepID=UPI00200EDF19|nr:uncharacterized protein LOC125235150 [Leguminivora glycinivorella]
MTVETRRKKLLRQSVEMAVNMTEGQFQQLLGVITSAARPAPPPTKHSSFAKATFFYDGKRDPVCVETFLTAATCFKNVGNISDNDAIRSLPLILKEDAAIWWNGIKDSVRTWADFESRLRRAFAPKKPAHMLFKQIVLTDQGPHELTETFVAKKRDLFAQLSEPLSETHQLDMVYGNLHRRIKERVPRETVLSFDSLLEAAQAAELLLHDEPSSRARSKERIRCNYCRIVGHTEDVCRRKAKEAATREAGRAATKTKPSAPVSATTATQAPSPSQPIFSCYGCGTPGVVRSKCPKCAEAKKVTKTERVDFCATGIAEDDSMDIRKRPVIGIGIDDITGTAFLDCGAKSNVASYQLYTCLKRRGYRISVEPARVTLADGEEKLQEVLKLRCMVKVCDRAVPTKFIVFPGKRDTRTLLGVPFLQDAGIVINLPQMIWHFVDNPTSAYELKEEDERAASTYWSDSDRGFGIATSAVLGRAPETRSRKSFLQRALPFDADLPTENATVPYQLIPVTIDDVPVVPLPKRTKSLFDGYSPRFVDTMYRDAQQTLLAAEVELSPNSLALFPEPSRTGINSLEIKAAESTLLDDSQKTQLELLLRNNEHVFQFNKEPTTMAEHAIETGNLGPISIPPYRLSPPRQKLLKEELQKMLEEKVIEPCYSAWAAPVVMVPKKDGSTRVCVDYRRLNAITVPDTYPIPRIDDLLHAAKPTAYMTTLDLRAGYWQVKVRDEDQDKTAFITPFGIYRFKRMPFGLRNAPATFQRLIDRVRVSLQTIKMLAYLDDLIIFSETFASHLTDLDQVFKRFKEINLTVNLDKCSFCCTTVKYLGHYITPEGLQVDPQKVAAITQMPAPGNLQQLLSFLQTCSWYRRFIPNFAKISEPLTRLTKKDQPWQWDTEQEEAFCKLKTCLTTAPVLKQADETKPYIIKADASSYALGAVLVQGEGQDEHPVEYASRLLIPAEKNYTTTEREALAVVWAIRKFRGYIEGLPVTIYTDHQALKWLMSLKSPTGRLARWALQIQAYDVTIKYLPGRTNVTADTLSRPFCHQENAGKCEICTVTVTDVLTRSPAEIRCDQLKDELVAKIVHALEGTDCENATYWSNKGYLVNKGLLYRYNPSEECEEAQLVVPQHEYANVLATYHDHPLAGHYGIEKTYQRIARRYYWKGMRKYIESYVKNCLPCQRYKPTNLKPAGLLQTTALNQRFEVVAFDLFGPLPVTKKEIHGSSLWKMCLRAGWNCSSCRQRTLKPARLYW